MSGPRVSVILPVYNAERHVGAAVRSVLEQAYTDFELICCDDGSTDRSGEEIQVAVGGDSRVRLIRRENLGLIATLNEMIGLARGEYVARMDADDISLQGRLAAQVGFLDGHPDVGVVGGQIETFGEGGEGGRSKLHTDSDIMICSLIFRNPLAHPTVMMRRDLFVRQGLAYEESAKHAEDYLLWIRVAEAGGRLGNLDEVVLRYRVHAGQVCQVHREHQERLGGELQLGLIRRRLGIEATEEEQRIHQALAFDRLEATEAFLVGARDWLEKLARANRARGFFPEVSFLKVLTGRWVSVRRFAEVRGVMVPEAPAVLARYVEG